MRLIAPRKRILNLVLSTAILATSTLAVPSYAGEMDCDDSTGINKVGCYALLGTISTIGGVVVGVSAIVDALTPSRTIDVRINDDPKIVKIKLKGLNNSNYVARARGRENPIPMQCELTPKRDLTSSSG